MAKKGNLVIENARLIFRNFAGAEKKFNRAGDRNFAVVIDDPDYAMVLENDGWNVKALEPRDTDKYPDEGPTYYIKVGVSFDNIPPTIYLISGGKKTLLNEDTVGVLDFASVINADIAIRPYPWEVNGKRGIKAYLKTLYITIEQDEFESKYADMVDDEPFMR